MEHDKPFASIALVLPYFGTFPNYFPLFLESCRNSPTVDWLIYTDSDAAYDYPENVKVHKTTLTDFRARLQESFDFPICLETPYKLCDFKATYGETLHSDLKEYDFWGHCDCDMIYGNIRNFITPEVTEKYTRILNSGHTILYRNIPEVNAYYRTQSYIDYKTVLSSPKSFSFDEWPGLSECWRRDGNPCYGELCFDDILIMAEDFRPVQLLPGGYVGPYHDQPCEAGRFRKMRNIGYDFHDGILERCWVQKGEVHREEVMYTHFQKRKMQVDAALTESALRRFVIIPNRFIPHTELTAEKLRSLAPTNRSMATTKSQFVFWALILKREIQGIGKPDYASCSVIKNLMNPSPKK